MRSRRAATDLMWLHGYGKTSPGTVMRASGVGQGSFYHHFPDKKSLGLAVIEDIVSRTSAALDEIFQDGTPPLTRIRKWIEAGRVRYRPPCDRGCPLGRLAIEMAHDNAEFREALAQGFGLIRTRLAQTLEDAGRSGHLDPSVHAGSLADLLLAGMEGAILVSQCVNDPEPIDRCLRALGDLLDRYELPGAAELGGNGAR